MSRLLTVPLFGGPFDGRSINVHPSARCVDLMQRRPLQVDDLVNTDDLMAALDPPVDHWRYWIVEARHGQRVGIAELTEGVS